MEKEKDEMTLNPQNKTEKEENTLSDVQSATIADEKESDVHIQKDLTAQKSMAKSIGMNTLSKLKESLFSVLPVAVIVLIFALTPITDFTTKEIVTFVVSAITVSTFTRPYDVEVACGIVMVEFSPAFALKAPIAEPTAFIVRTPLPGTVCVSTASEGTSFETT